MITFDELIKLENKPAILNVDEMTLRHIYTQYGKFKNLDNVDRHYKKKTTDYKYYEKTIRPIIKHLFELNSLNNSSIDSPNNLPINELIDESFDPLNIVIGQTSKSIITKPMQTKLMQTKPIQTKPIQTKPIQTKLIQTKPIQTKQIFDYLKIHYDPFDPNNSYDKLELNNSQKQVKTSYVNNGISNGIICHATGTGKTNCEFITINENSQMIENPELDIVFVCCYYKNIINQMFHSNNLFDYKKFYKLANSNIFDIWSYDIYDLSNNSIRDQIMSNIESIKKIKRRKIFLINFQYMARLSNLKYVKLPLPKLILHDELHTITGEKTFDFMTYFRKKESIIIGLSATPIRNPRSESNYDKLRYIFSAGFDNLDDVNNSNKPINIISEYSNVQAMIDGLILKLEIFWYEVKLEGTSTENRSDKTNCSNCIQMIHKVCDFLPNKKILIWCGTIKHAKHMYELLKSDQSIIELFNSNIFIDHSQLDIDQSTTSSYTQFKALTSNCIMVCADKYQTGSDIEYLDCVVFADMIRNKSQIVFIQCVGRVQRLGYKKTVGYVIDHYDSDCGSYQIKISDIINKLITYYWEFYTRSANSNIISSHKTAIELYNHILSTYEFEMNDDHGLIKLCLNSKLAINIHTGLNNLTLNDVKSQFKSKIINHIKNEQNLEIDELLRFEYKAFGTSNVDFYDIQTKQEYMTKITTFDLEPEPEIRFASFWTNWYDYLNLPNTYTSDINEWRRICKKLKIKSSNDYMAKAKISSNNLPLMPDELYPIKSLMAEFDNFNDDFLFL
jgi:hypothetical protein